MSDGDGAPALDDGGDADIILEACKASPTFRRRYDLATWRVIGAGGFSVVARVFARPWGKDVAVKVLYKRHLSDPIREKVREEALCSERVGGDNVVRVYSPNETENLFWIEMESVDGRDLEAELAAQEGRPLPWARALAIGRSVSTAVARAHALEPPVIHRDIKPANILLPKDGRPAAKLGDFGISKIGEVAGLSRSGGIPGTPLYTPPEIWQGETYSPASDVYCLGLVLFEAFTGRPALPITREMTEWQVQKAHALVPPARARAYVPDLPLELEDLLQATLAKKPHQRPTAREVSERLARLEIATEDPVGRAPSRGRILAAAAAVCVCLLTIPALLRGPSGGAPLPEEDTRAQEPLPAPTLSESLPERAEAPRPSSGAPEGEGRAGSGDSPALRVSLSVTDGEIDIVNEEPEPIREIRVTVFDAGGRPHDADVPGFLAPGEGAMVSRAQLDPQMPLDTHPARATVKARTSHGRSVQVFGLGP